MIMADVFKILFLILGTLIVVVSYWLLFEALFPRLVDRARTQYDRKPFKTLLLGLAITIPVTILGIALVSAPAAPAKLLGFVCLSGLTLLGLLGSAGLSRKIGLHLPSSVDADQPWRCVLRGGTILSITFVLPFIGWFFVLPVTLVSGVGAAIGAYREERKARPAASDDTPAGLAQA